eukprot:11095070-Lingulodinium_polyedra.AAC.1
MVAPYNPDDAETWIPQTPSPDTMPPFNPELETPSPVATSRTAEQQVQSTTHQSYGPNVHLRDPGETRKTHRR